MEKKTQRPFQNPLWFCLRFLFSVSLYGTQHISENSLLGEGGSAGWGNGGGEVKKMQHLTWQLHLLVKIMNAYKASAYEAALSQFMLIYTSNSSSGVKFLQARNKADQQNHTDYWITRLKTFSENN